MKGDGNGWSASPDGGKTWGRFGAAGLFLVANLDSGPELLLQHRAYWTAGGGTWAVPGGARDSHETPAEAALREAVEETSIDPERVEILSSIQTAGPYPADPSRPELAGGWTYTTVLARTSERLSTSGNDESLELAWVPLDQLAEYDLLPPFAAALPGLVVELRAQL